MFCVILFVVEVYIPYIIHTILQVNLLINSFIFSLICLLISEPYPLMNTTPVAQFTVYVFLNDFMVVF